VTFPAEDVRSMPLPPARIDVGGLGFDHVTEAQAVGTVEQGLLAGVGGWIVTPNVDIWLRTRREPQCADLVARANLVVADGMPLVWAAWLAGTPLPQRVAGSTLVERLCEVAGRHERGVYIIGGGAGNTAELAGIALAGRYPGLRFAGWLAPEFGFEKDPSRVAEIVAQVRASGAHLVLVGLGFPKQERLAEELCTQLPGVWALGCGGGVAMAAGEAKRSPAWAQRLGVEWVVRLVQEPRRLAHRYLVDDAPAAVVLLGQSLRRRLSRGRRARQGSAG
jgi:N-acetylglucosaminyldiphosphoundecaprenol N-acetyl-beta-D-mannosaminyltransferase